MLHLLGNNGQPVREQLALDVTHFFNHSFFYGFAAEDPVAALTIVTQPANLCLIITNSLESGSCEDLGMYRAPGPRHLLYNREGCFPTGSIDE